MTRKSVIKTRGVIFSCILVFAGPLFARDKTDLIVMQNGDRMTGEVKGLDSGVLYVSLDYVDGRISVQWSKVAYVESTQSFLVQADNGSVYSGTLATAKTPIGGPAKVQVGVTEGKEVEIEQLRVVKIVQTSDNFWQRFNGSINTGIIYSKGNHSTQFTLGSEVAYPRERWAAQASFNSTLSAGKAVNPSTRNQFTFNSLRLSRWNNWYYTALGSLLQSSVQEITLQTTIGGGVGHYLKNSNHAKIAVIGGFAWQNTEYTGTAPTQGTQNVAAGVLATQLNFFRFKKTNLNVTGILLPAVSEPGRVHFDTNASYYIKLFSDLSWNATFYGNFDNRPPRALSGSDYGSSSGLSWTFGNR